MKIINKVFALVVIIACASSVLNQAVDYPPEYNQKYNYPNNFEAPTNVTQFDSLNYTTPYLSHVLFEADPRKKIRRHEFFDLTRFQAFRLTKGEADSIFNFADGNRDDLLSSDEWDSFNGLYVFPFEACDMNHDYLLDEAEFSNCFDKDPRSRFIVFRRKHNQNKYKEMMWTVTSRAEALLNFHDYLFIRRALFAWKNCQSNSKFISKGAFKCAVRSAILSNVHFTGDLDIIYNAGINLSNDVHLIELDFINYLRTLYCAYVFTSFGQPINIPFIEKTAFLKALKEDRLPTNFEESEVKYLYELINTNPMIPVTKMNYESFQFFWGYHRLWNKYQVERPLLLTKDELIRLIDDEFNSQKFTIALDRARTRFTSAQYQEASLVLQKKRPNEAKYFFSFKQDGSENTAMLWNKTTVNATYFNHTNNRTNREVLFSIFANVNKEVWTKDAYYKAMALSNLYVSLISDWRQLVSAPDFVDKLMDQYTKVNPPISFTQRDNYQMYKYLPREVYIDILTFLSIENYKYKFRAYLRSSNTNIYESYARLMLADFGMENMPDTVLDTARKGYDNLRRRTYDPNELMKNCFIVHSVAAENVRSNAFVTDYGLKENHDPSRRFPRWPRRAQASPWV